MRWSSLLAAATLVAALVLPVAAPALAQQSGPRRVPLEQFEALPAAPVEVSPEVRQLRDELLGPDWDEPGTASLYWTGVSSFIVAFDGHLLLFDAWEIIGAVEDYLPIGREELAAIKPEAVLVGHGHFDHAGDLGYVAGRAGSVVVGSQEICTVAQQGAVREGVGTDFTCAITGTMTSPDPGVAQQVELFADVAPLTILQHVHSAARPPGEDNPADPFAPVMDPQPYIEHFQDNPEELQRFLAQQQESQQGGTWLYHLRAGDFTLLIGDSAGPIFEHPAVREALDAFPGCVDVMANAILGFDQPVSGLRDPRLYVQYAHPKVFLPTHADAWAPVISAGQAQYREELASQFARLEHPPETDFLLDPQDYLNPRTYRFDDARWAAPMPGSSCAAAAEENPPAAVPDSATPAAATADDRAPADGATPGLPATGGGVGIVAVLVAGAIVAGWRRR